MAASSTTPTSMASAPTIAPARRYSTRMDAGAPRVGEAMDSAPTRKAMIVAMAASVRGSKAVLAIPASMRRLRPEASARMSSTPWPMSAATPVKKRCTPSAMRS
ncbi:hypothetical protein G6F24_017650 [Rhizopus arrhizus]|nr:hypothetical protein G6F24_017650 [Rhizopus arrhizus]